ncbi:MAG: lytic transglycosylase domain-containing protein [Desulfomonilaceae bacterium]|nr:lytic transglycosylase domain-containing protein [Desulfomonilaceae bacterium]
MIDGKKKCTLGAVAVCLVLWGIGPADCGATTRTITPHLDSINTGFRYGLPPEIEKRGLVCASQRIPLDRPDVRRRILQEINYLLLDRRSQILIWLERADYYKPVILPILRQYKLPSIFHLLPAIESSYDPRALSSAGAYGYWQFIRSTATCGPVNCDEYDWKMLINQWKDERGDLVRSTHSGARYLAWMNRVRKVGINGQEPRDGFQDWLLTTAAYNAGPARVLERLNLFGASSYWDVPLPLETEQYVPRLIAMWIISNNREFYGVKGRSRGEVAFDTLTNVRLAKDLSFAAMAKLLQTTPRHIWKLNAQISPTKLVFPAKSGRKSIAHTIRVPKGTAGKFRSQLAANGYTRK